MKKANNEQQERSERFYKWLQKCGNIYLSDNERIVRAFNLITV